MQMARSRAQPIKCEYFWRLANQESVILPRWKENVEKMLSVSTNQQSVILPSML